MDGYFSGYASIFGEPDQGGDIVMPGSFSISLARKGAKGIRLLFQHDPKEPIGKITAINEDQTGLRVEGKLFNDVPRAHALCSLISGGAVDGLSIGFRTIKATRDKLSGHRKLFLVDLWEVSIVTFPMMERARIISGSKPPDVNARLIRTPQETIAAAISLISNQ